MHRYTMTLGLLIMLLVPSSSLETNAAVTASSPDAIDALWIEPPAPTTADFITLYVSGEWPTGGYVLEHTWSAVYGNLVTLDMFWRVEGLVPYVLTEYEHAEPLGKLSEGAYTVLVRCWVNGLPVDQGGLEFEVVLGDPRPPHHRFPWDWPFSDLPWDFDLPW